MVSTGSSDTLSPRHLLILDVVVVVAVLGYGLLVQGVPAVGTSPLSLLVQAGLCLPHLLRRRFPTETYAITLAFGIAQLGLGMGPLVADVMVAVSLWSLATLRPLRVSLFGAAAALAWLVALGLLHLGRGGFDLGELSTGVLLVAVAWFAGRLKRTRRAHLVSLRERAEYLERQRESELRMASINERTRIARDLHDVISHSLSAVTLLADGAVASVDTNPADARDAMVRVRDTSREAMKQMRSMLSVLRTDDDQDLTPAPRLDDVSSLLAEARAAGTPVHASLAEVDAPADVQVVAYRVIQEALTNVRKHAKTAQRVEVEITRINRELRIRVTDDGQDSTQPEQGHGLIGMTERVTALGGILHASHYPTGGFEILAQLPLRRENP